MNQTCSLPSSDAMFPKKQVDDVSVPFCGDLHVCIHGSLELVDQAGPSLQMDAPWR